MKIALLSWETANAIAVGGVAVHVSELAHALQRKGHDVHVFTRMSAVDHSKYECSYGVHYHKCVFDSNPDFVEEINNMCRSFVQRFIDVENCFGIFDIVHAHDWLTANAMSWIKEGRGTKSILTMHSTEYGRCGNNFFGGTSARVREVEWSGTYHADNVIAVSNTLKSEVQRIYSTPDWKVDVIYNGITYFNLDGKINPKKVRSQYDIGPMDPMVLFVGRMVYQKGPDILVESIPNILKFYPNAKFVFAGDGEMRWAVEQTAHHIGVSHATRFLGLKKGKELQDIFKATDCVCVPSRNEPFGIVILESWAAGKPVIATVIGGPSEIVWHEVNGYKVEPTPDSISWGIGTLFEDFEHGRWMGHNGRITVENVFNWNLIADEVLYIYEN